MDCCLDVYTTTVAERLAIATALNAAGGLLEDAVMKLYENVIPTLTPRIALSDLTEATFTGYAAVDPYVFSAPGFADDDQAKLQGAAAVFTAGSPLTTPGVAYGAYLVSDAGVLLGVWPFPDGPLQWDVPGRQHTISLLLLQPGG